MNKNAWISTYTGKKFFPLDPIEADIDIEDIAQGLSNLCRFAGQTRFFYSVAQHSVLVSQIVDPTNALAGLLHDASEGIGLNDIVSPLKHTDEFAFYRKAEHILQSMIYKKFGLNVEEPAEVKEADLKVRVTEIRDLMPQIAATYNTEYKPLNFQIIPLLPIEAKQLFLNRFKELTDAK